MCLSYTQGRTFNILWGCQVEIPQGPCKNEIFKVMAELSSYLIHTEVYLFRVKFTTEIHSILPERQGTNQLFITGGL